MGIKLITAPTSDPITLTEAKAHLRVVDSDDDTLISALITAATKHCENWTGRAFVDQTWELTLDSFPTGTTGSTAASMGIEIPKPPLIEVLSVKYDDTAGVEQTLDPTAYFVDDTSEPGWIVFTGSSWPSTIDAINSVRVQFRAGFADNNSPSDKLVPEDIKAAIKLTLGSLYEHRESQVVGTIANVLPFAVEALLRPYRVLLGMA